MDLTQELERSIPMGPPLPPPAERLVAGRRALRRRRAAAAVGAAAVVVALAVPIAALGGSTADRGTDVPPAEPAPSASESPEGDASSSEPTGRPRLRGNNLAWVDVDAGELRVHPGAVVHERRDDVFPGKDTKSVALDLSLGDRRQWVLLEWSERGGVASYARPGSGSYENFDDFVADEVRTGGVTHGPPVGPDPPGAGL